MRIQCNKRFSCSRHRSRVQWYKDERDTDAILKEMMLCVLQRAFPVGNICAFYTARSMMDVIVFLGWIYVPLNIFFFSSLKNFILKKVTSLFLIKNNSQNVRVVRTEEIISSKFLGPSDTYGSVAAAGYFIGCN